MLSLAPFLGKPSHGARFRTRPNMAAALQASPVEFAVVVLAVLTCIGHLVVIGNLLRRRHLLRSPLYVTLLSLAASACLSALISLAFHVQPPLLPVMCSLNAFLGLSSDALHVLSCAFLLIERSLAFRSAASRGWPSPLRVRTVVAAHAVLWLLSFSLPAPLLVTAPAVSLHGLPARCTWSQPLPAWDAAAIAIMFVFPLFAGGGGLAFLLVRFFSAPMNPREALQVMETPSLAILSSVYMRWMLQHSLAVVVAPLTSMVASFPFLLALCAIRWMDPATTMSPWTLKALELVSNIGAALCPFLLLWLDVVLRGKSALPWLEGGSRSPPNSAALRNVFSLENCTGDLLLSNRQNLLALGKSQPAGDSSTRRTSSTAGEGHAFPVLFATSEGLQLQQSCLSEEEAELNAEKLSPSRPKRTSVLCDVRSSQDDDDEEEEGGGHKQWLPSRSMSQEGVSNVWRSFPSLSKLPDKQSGGRESGERRRKIPIITKFPNRPSRSKMKKLSAVELGSRQGSEFKVREERGMSLSKVIE